MLLNSPEGDKNHLEDWRSGFKAFYDVLRNYKMFSRFLKTSSLSARFPVFQET